jgi:hypothetical protein
VSLAFNHASRPAAAKALDNKSTDCSYEGGFGRRFFWNSDFKLHWTHGIYAHIWLPFNYRSASSGLLLSRGDERRNLAGYGPPCPLSSINELRWASLSWITTNAPPATAT